MHLSPRSLQRVPWLLRPLFWLQRRRYGQLLTPSLVWARNPWLFTAVSALYAVLDRRRSPLEPVLRSLVTVRVSQINWCEFCIDINSATLAERAGSMDKVLALAEWRDSPLFTELERVALEYAECVTAPGSRVPAELMDRVKERFSEEQLLELTALIAFQNMSTKFNSALAIAPQGFCQLPPRSDGA